MKIQEEKEQERIINEELTVDYSSMTTQSHGHEIPVVDQANYIGMMNTIVSESGKITPALKDLEEKVKTILDDHRLEFNVLEERLKAGI